MGVEDTADPLLQAVAAEVVGSPVEVKPMQTP